MVNLPLTHLSELSAKLDPTQPIVAVCNSAYRSSMAVGLLERKGFKQVGSLAGGSEARISAGLPVFGADQKPGADSPVAATTPKRTVKLPERIAASELKNLIMDLPGTFELVDIRPPPLYADYSIPGSQNADVAEVMSNPAYLTGAGPLIIVDRDSSLAMAVAGILSHKTQRPIKALYGGGVSYWQESELKNAVKPVDIQGAGGAGGARRALRAWRKDRQGLLPLRKPRRRFHRVHRRRFLYRRSLQKPKARGVDHESKHRTSRKSVYESISWRSHIGTGLACVLPHPGGRTRGVGRPGPNGGVPARWLAAKPHVRH